jgi:hypothetical protein
LELYFRVQNPGITQQITLLLVSYLSRSSINFFFFKQLFNMHPILNPQLLFGILKKPMLCKQWLDAVVEVDGRASQSFQIYVGDVFIAVDGNLLSFLIIHSSSF